MSFIIGGASGAKSTKKQAPAAPIQSPTAGHPKKITDDDMVVDVTEAEFAREVVQASMRMPVVVDFWAEWCGPCKTLGPLIEKAVRAAHGKVRLVKIDVDKNQAIAQQLRIQSIPTVYAFFQGRPVDGFVGAQTESQLKSFIERLAQMSKAETSVGMALEGAKQALDAGDLQTAAETYSMILEGDPTVAEAHAGLARALLAAGQIEDARAVLDQVPEDLVKHADVVSARTELDLAAEAAEGGELAELRGRVAADENDHQARFDLGMALYGEGRKEEAMEAMLEIVRRDRGWNDDGARKQLVKFFEAFGPTHPLTVKGRRRLSSLLFS